MQFRSFICLVVTSVALAAPLVAQEGNVQGFGPVTKREVRVSLALSPETKEGIAAANKELIEKIKRRGVDFVLSKEEEWVFQLQDASDELIQTIRNALSGEERNRIMNESAKIGLYRAFMNNYGRTDIASMQIAVTAGREYIQRYRNDPKASQEIALIQRTIPALENSIRRSYRPLPVVTTGRRRGNQ